MVNLINSASGQQVGTISEEQLQFLIDNLEEEWSDDKVYFINPPTIAMLESRGADAALVAMLRNITGEEGIDLRWVRAL